MRRPHDTDHLAWVERLAIPHHQREAVWHLILSGPPALDAVRAGLAHDDPAVRRGCTDVLDHLVDDAALEDLVAMVTDDDAEVRVKALHALACDRCKENGCSPSISSVLPAAIDRIRNDDDPHVRAMAIGAIGRWVIERALAAVQHAHAHDPSPAVRKKAAWHVPGGPLYVKLEQAAKRARRRVA
jgi:HEAT repeat protein